MLSVARSVFRARGFAITAVLALALGIGLAAAVLTVANALLVQRLPVVDQDRVVVMSGESHDRRVTNWPLTYADAREFADHSRTLSGAATYVFPGSLQTIVDADGTIAQYNRAMVAGNFFEVMGARPLLGRTLRSEDDVPGAASVLVLSYRAWQDRFGGARDIVGRSVLMKVNDVRFTIVGVMPQGLDFPPGVDAWTAERGTIPGGDLTNVQMDLLGRLAPSATPSNAAQELTALFARATGRKKSSHGVAYTLPALVVGDVRPAVLAFVAAVSLLLLITCINVANLLLVRGAARAKEIAVRSALGASRTRLIAQLLAESSVLATIGGTLGGVVAAGSVRAFVALAPPGFPRIDELHVDASAFALILLVTISAMLLFAVAPAFLSSAIDAVEVLHSGSRHGATRRFRRLADALVVGQVALSLVVLSAAALVTRSFINLERANLALESSHVLIAELSLRYPQYDTAPKQLAMLDGLLPAVAAMPGVRAVSPVVAPPFSAVAWDGVPRTADQTAEDAKNNPTLNMELVAPSYFETLGIPILQGRGFTPADRRGSTRVVMLSESAARAFWPSQNPLGRRIGNADTSMMGTVIGIVPDTRYRDLRVARATIYFALAQSEFPFAPTELAIKTAGDPASVVPALRRVLSETSPGVTLVRAAPFDSYLSGPLAQPRLDATLLFVFALAAVLLSAVGLFGVLATAVRQRTREFGVRLALGATPAGLAGLVLGRAFVLAGTGIIAGLAVTAMTTRWLASLLFEVSPTDVTTLVVVAFFVLAVATLSSLVPARLSASVDPVVALRAD